MPIVPGGRNIPLTYSNRKEYVEKAVYYRLHEFDKQVRYAGFVGFVPSCCCHGNGIGAELRHLAV